VRRAWKGVMRPRQAGAPNSFTTMEKAVFQSRGG
jgi:hypothetical protein